MFKLSKNNFKFKTFVTMFLLMVLIFPTFLLFGCNKNKGKNELYISNWQNVSSLISASNSGDVDCMFSRYNNGTIEQTKFEERNSKNNKYLNDYNGFNNLKLEELCNFEDYYFASYSIFDESINTYNYQSRKNILISKNSGLVYDISTINDRDFDSNSKYHISYSIIKNYDKQSQSFTLINSINLKYTSVSFSTMSKLCIKDNGEFEINDIYNIADDTDITNIGSSSANTVKIDVDRYNNVVAYYAEDDGEQNLVLKCAFVLKNTGEKVELTEKFNLFNFNKTFYNDDFSKKIDEDGNVVDNTFIPNTETKYLTEGSLFDISEDESTYYYMTEDPIFYYRKEDYYTNSSKYNEDYKTTLNSGAIEIVHFNEDGTFEYSRVSYPFALVEMLGGVIGINKDGIFKVNKSYDGTYTQVNLDYPIYNRQYVSVLSNLSINKARFEVKTDDGRVLKCVIDVNGNIDYVNEFEYEVLKDSFDYDSGRLSLRLHLYAYWQGKDLKYRIY